MTKQEAIKRLKEYAQYSYGIYHNGEKDEIAFNMAIAALKQLSLPKIIIGQGEQEHCDKRTDKRIDTIPSADRPTGHWVDDDEQQILMKKFIEKGENWKVCNICGAGMRVGAKYDTDKQYHDFFHNFCPNCGARMESEEE